MKAHSPKAKGLHPANLHQHGYDFTALMASHPPLRAFVRPNPYGALSIDFAKPDAVKALNAALLVHHYRLSGWDIPKGYLCPPIPGRVDYLHYLADLVGERRVDLPLLDIGTGANGIYALLWASHFGGDVVASDIATASLNNVARVLAQNPGLGSKISLRHQADPGRIFSGVVGEQERFIACVCNPPFHASAAEAASGSDKKRQGLAKSRAKGMDSSPPKAGKPALNFGGQAAELWCDGGERRFLFRMIDESAARPQLCLWFTSLVSKGENVRPCKRRLEKLGATEIRVIDMHQGMKITRVLAWRFGV